MARKLLDLYKKTPLTEKELAEQRIETIQRGKEMAQSILGGVSAAITSAATSAFIPPKLPTIPLPYIPPPTRQITTMKKSDEDRIMEERHHKQLMEAQQTIIKNQKTSIESQNISIKKLDAREVREWYIARVIILTFIVASLAYVGVKPILGILLVTELVLIAVYLNIRRVQGSK